LTGGIEAIVFDIGNVLVQWDPRHLYRKVFVSEAEMEAFLGEVCTMQWHLEHDRGLSFAENAARLKVQHPDKAGLIDLWGGRYGEMVPDRVADVAPLVEALDGAGIALHGLTNMPVGFFPELCARFSELRLLRETVVSGEEGLLKPDAAIYEVLIGRAGLTPSRALFIDDSPRNVEAAVRLGFHGHRFTGAGELAAELRSRGLLRPS
jgi:FMN phosphatase YigB (HAD superfamily)